MTLICRYWKELIANPAAAASHGSCFQDGFKTGLITNANLHSVTDCIHTDHQLFLHFLHVPAT